MAVLSPHSLITLYANEVNSPVKRHRVVGWIKNKTQLYADSRRLISVLSKGLQNDTLSKWRPKESRHNHTHIRLQTKKVNKRQRWALYTNDKGYNLFRKHIH